MDYQERIGFTSGCEEERGAREQAAYWVDTLEDAPHEVDHARFFAWLRESPKHVEELLLAIAINDSLFDFDYVKHGLSLDLRHAGGIVELLPPRASTSRATHPTSAKVRVRWLKGLAAALLVAAAGAALQLHLSGTETRFQSALGEIRHLTLSDGSRVTLNTNTMLIVRFTHNSRLVTLLQGEADFTVASDRQRPFNAIAGGAVVRALGTRFSVRLAPDQTTEVIVSSGRVSVGDARNNEPATELSASERAVVSNGKLIRHESLSEARIDHEFKWLSGRLDFAGETIAEAAAEFNRYNRRKIMVADDAARRMRLSGSFRINAGDDFIASLQSFALVPIVSSADVIVLDVRPPVDQVMKERVAGK